MKLVYIAGKYRGETPWDVEQNVRRAEEAGLHIAKLGAMPVIPHAMLRFFDKQCLDMFWLDGTAALLRRCDAAVFLIDWESSKGAQKEHVVATADRLPIFYQAQDYSGLHLWLRSRALLDDNILM